MDDLIEFCGPHCIEYKDFFVPLISSNLKSPHPELRQAAAYGLGVLAKHGGDTFAQVMADNLPVLIAIIQDGSSRLAENVCATENAISAITKIIQFNSSLVNLGLKEFCSIRNSFPFQVDVDSLLPAWLGWLPIWEDDEEVIYVYDFLCKLLER